MSRAGPTDWIVKWEEEQGLLAAYNAGFITLKEYVAGLCALKARDAYRQDVIEAQERVRR